MNVVHKNIINEGARLRLILKDKGIKVIDFARLAGFSNQNAHNYLKQGDIKRATLTEFCKHINITLDQFYNWNQEIKTDPFEAHQGKRLAALIEMKGVNKTKLAERVGLSRRALYNQLERETLTDEQLKRILPGLQMTLSEFLNPQSTYDPGLELAQVQTWREKYYGCLEDYKKLTQQHDIVRQRGEQDLAMLRQENELLKARLDQLQEEVAFLKSAGNKS